MNSILLGSAVLVLLLGMINLSIGVFYGVYDFLPPLKYDLYQYLSEMGLPNNRNAGIGTAVFFGIPQVLIAVWAIPRIRNINGAAHGSR